jgi:DNA-binding PucR family transcriptional regulator
MLSRFPVEQLRSEALPPGLMRLFEADGGESLAETLERYLDLASDAKAAAASLSLHRASLYYRLHKIEELTGVTLKDGEQRLALHLGLKLARLAGLRPETVPS